MELFARGEAYPLLPRRRADPGPALLGSVGATIEPTMGIATVGYWLDGAATGRGVGVRCVGRLVELLLEERHVGHVGLSTAVHNTRSRALAERCGFSRDAALPGHQRIAGADVDCIAYVRRR
jgi:ribosomal-protein-serine acetyltransferase